MSEHRIHTPYEEAALRHAEELAMLRAELMHHLRLMLAETSHRDEVQQALKNNDRFFITDDMVRSSKDPNVQAMVFFQDEMVRVERVIGKESAS